MFEDNKPSRLLPENDERRPRRAMGGVYNSRLLTRLLLLLALGCALFGGVGLDICLTEPMWQKHLWIPSLLLAITAWILITALTHAIRRALLGK